MAFWKGAGGISQGHADLLRLRGHTVRPFFCHEPPPPALDVVLANGPLGSLAPLGGNLLALPASGRPPLAFVQTEQLPNPQLPEWWRAGIGRLRSGVERAVVKCGPDGAYRVRPGWGGLIRFGLRYRYYGDLFWLRDAGLLHAVAAWSYVMADFLRQRGFEVVVPEVGRSSEMGRDMGLERDIPALWLGKVGSRRRQRLLTRLRAELEARGVPLLVVDGVQHPYVFGEDRTRLLNRTKIMVNLLRSPWDDNSLRHTLAANNRCMLISEPMLPHSAFRPGEHVVEAPVEQLADTICHYLAHDDERRAYADRAYNLLASGPRRGEGIERLVRLAVNSARGAAGSVEE